MKIIHESEHAIHVEHGDDYYIVLKRQGSTEEDVYKVEYEDKRVNESGSK